MVRFRGGLLKLPECHHMGEGWPNRHITFIVSEKAYFTVSFALFMVYGKGVG